MTDYRLHEGATVIRGTLFYEQQTSDSNQRATSDIVNLGCLVPVALVT